MHSADLLPSLIDLGADVHRSRLIVTRRGVDDGIYRAIGYLDQVDAAGASPTYEFTYLARVASDPGFVPIVGFRDLTRHYRSPRLFPSFADRVMSAKRPDRPQYLTALDLDADAGAWEVLTASGGHREGDPIELISLPRYHRATGKTSAHFLAHGVRHRGAEVSAHITQLASGHRLGLEPDPGNPVNIRAVRIVDDGLHIGFVPDPLLDYVHSILAGGHYALTVVRANPAETHPHLRLLLRLSGRCSYFVFDGPDWRHA
ncbi:hypothetical protein [Mycobacterium angelicum]|uniref:HIRAN domain-containing protein n=1 Tax=Mycobacterium angelicum TaxID=470074 RepID=A0A1W9ZTV9_MYCAN|nr:hypothetical protein [Mycobacterium angelicum]MCV7198173.1 hypothetical protein [Mycobacterium angelicum]ORA21181.1 hypothetical protein BST12_13310 [Mycobacterium angelicum]